MVKFYFRVLIFFLFTQTIGLAQRITQDVLMLHYLERRILSLEDRLKKCDQDRINYMKDMQDFSKNMLSRLDGLNVYKAEFKNEVENLSFRVERVERDIDYLEAVIPSQTCVEVNEKIIEDQLKEAEEKKKYKSKLVADCDTMFASIKSLKIVKKTGDSNGSWMKDPGKDTQKIYFFSGFKNNTLLEFKNIRAFTENNMKVVRNVVLPFSWQGTGHVVYNGFLFFHKHGTVNEIIKLNLRNKTMVDRMLLVGAGRMPAYQLSPFTLIDFAVDELGLWAIYSDTKANIMVVKIDHLHLAVENSWDTLCTSKNAEAAFLMCGTLYVVYNSHNGGRSRIQCLFDVYDIITNDETSIIYFPSRFSSHSMMHYNPKEKQLFSWDDGYQTIYNIATKKKTEIS
ncbi:olfactomedin-like protein 1 [Latimeria chalumnae]|uniref:Olfactomedin like 1 n=1 Tax=Latimeria chalumnae TaxID=7897 RepID=H3AUH8_LATCH|nr:PREDICTED: olfactomedin-like protein 1 [Latimeria chalumnae]|eukprot:XP_006004399.1 PREDICTED: olfactomedin-like protein 1 [Latimeria chalumnae]